MDYNQIKRLFPRKLANHESFSIFVELASTELNKVFDAVSIMATLSNVDRCPEVFIEHLGELVDFDWSNFLQSDIQRECMKLKWDTHRYKGTKEDLEFAATYGDIDGYQGGRLFVPGCDADLTMFRMEDLIYNEGEESYKINYASYKEDDSELTISPSHYDISYKEDKPTIIYETSSSDVFVFGETVWGSEATFISKDNLPVTTETVTYSDTMEMIIEEKPPMKPRAVVSLPREALFSFDISEHDGEHYIPDNIVYKEGTILIEVTRINQAIMDRVETVKPIGMLVVYKYIHDGTFEYITHTRTLREVNL